jgi:murein DD-endopeptidase MepM/ murein hydrolase activator NlpD
MADHRASRGARNASRGVPGAASSTAGKRKAVKHAAPRGPLVKGLPSAPVMLGMAALSLSATGAVSAAADQTAAAASPVRFAAPANALSGSTDVGSTKLDEARAEVVSRDSQRDALETATSEKLQDAAEEQAEQRATELAKLARAAQVQAKEIKANSWVTPVAPGDYRITEGFGDGVSWRGYAHTGLDFAAPSGTPIHAVASGTITFAGYAGGCGNMTMQVLDDGTELKYCHQSAISTSVGARVTAGQIIGYVGNTGHSTGPHVHLEVHPGGGDAVDPFAALVAHGVTP